ncbi:hormonally up-regulated neu tumor-associated kinase-like isoform B [Alligator mississippiensis]|uniref:non-specific serine/threonine protein kinase n=1 Tax=Alligator mississippiensis TaxID=8496 RepID=A0A151MU04_ALLMI|nr:hormonally up-regulated neu tumor-associated kinase-like isoform B [Alligator mississippiensis]
MCRSASLGVEISDKKGDSKEKLHLESSAVNLTRLRMPTAVNLDRTLPEREKTSRNIPIPVCFSKIPQEAGKNFPHTKQVGTYLVGKMINKGSFAKVMEGLHILTGEKLYETLETENSYYMVMELCLGGDLMDRICDKKKLEEKEVRKYTQQIMAAVEHLHRHGIVHRDLKIENFLLDENNNIKIVDFGLSNAIKFEGLSQELLNTQCGSPAYAAPELLAHKNYGPKVDVWSIGVSMFAMLTGTLPFTVEPFNIKQLHQKMVTGEISPIPPDISPGAVHFIHSLLEPDPARRPSVKEAMKDKWLNEGFIRKPLNSITYKNRLYPEELNPVVLNYMTKTMELSLSEVINILINNRPSSVMASYCLLLRKLMSYQKEQKTMKWENIVEKCNGKPPKHMTQESDIQIFQKAKVATTEGPKNCDDKTFPSALTPAMPDAIKEDEIAITLENQENVLEVSKFADRELVHLEPPKSPNQTGLCEPIKHPPVSLQENMDDSEEILLAKQEAWSIRRPRKNCSYITSTPVLQTDGLESVKDKRRTEDEPWGTSSPLKIFQACLWSLDQLHSCLARRERATDFYKTIRKYVHKQNTRMTQKQHPRQYTEEANSRTNPRQTQ